MKKIKELNNIIIEKYLLIKKYNKNHYIKRKKNYEKNETYVFNDAQTRKNEIV